MSLPYEIHVTVRSPDLNAFRAACVALGVKPIVLDLQDRTGTTVLQDVMTSSKGNYDSYDEAFNAAVGIAADLQACAFDVVRIKIESVPWHPVAPNGNNGIKMGKGQYFESHIAIYKPSDDTELREIQRNLFRLHVSKNVFKTTPFGEIILLTYRTSDMTAQEFIEEVDFIRDVLTLHEMAPIKIEKEFCVFDSASDHDKAWITA